MNRTWKQSSMLDLCSSSSSLTLHRMVLRNKIFNVISVLITDLVFLEFLILAVPLMISTDCVIDN